MPGAQAEWINLTSRWNSADYPFGFPILCEPANSQGATDLSPGGDVIGDGSARWAVDLQPPIMEAVTPRFFANVEELRDWFEENHKKLDEQWIGYYKKNSGIPSIDWPQSVDAALCYGWIDGIRKSRDALSYKIRFTPRRPRSNWSARNISRMEALIAQGLVTPAGLAAFNARDPAQARASRERGPVTLPEEYEARLRANAEAWRYFRAARPSYRKQVALWVTSAKKETTKLRRLRILIESSAQGEPIPPLRWTVRENRRAK